MSQVHVFERKLALLAEGRLAANAWFQGSQGSCPRV